MTYRRTKTVVPYTADQMFALVADVERYPQFLPHCSMTRIVRSDLEDGSGVMIVDMVVSYGAFREKYRSQVTLDRKKHRIETTHIEGPFRKLDNVWVFTEIESGTEVDFTVDFEFRNAILQTAAAAFLERAFSKMSDAFVERAGEVYRAQD